jgi:hypothetical protein
MKLKGGELLSSVPHQQTPPYTYFVCGTNLASADTYTSQYLIFLFFIF